MAPPTPSSSPSRADDLGNALDLDNIEFVTPDQLALPDGDAGVALRYLTGLTPDRIRLLNTGAVLAHPLYETPTES